MRLYAVKLADGLRVKIMARSSCIAFIIAQEITGQFACDARPA